MIETASITIRKTEHSKLSQVDFDNIIFGRIFSDHMMIADFVDNEWTDSRIVPFAPLKMSPANVTLHYGMSIFEGMKAFRGDDGRVLLFRPQDNARRLNISAKRMCLAEVPEELFMEGLIELISLDSEWVPKQQGTSLYIRPFVFATDEYIGIKPSDTFKFMIITSPVGPYYEEPVRVMIETKYSRAVQGGTGFAKASGNYGGSLYPAKLAREQGYHQLIWTDAKEHKYIEESGTMNVLFLLDDTLVTAPVGDTILDGITRDSVLTLARDMGVNVEERKVSVDEVVESAKTGKLKEAFGCGTAATIASISNIGLAGEDYALPTEMPLANQIRQALSDIKCGRVDDKFGWTLAV